MEYERNALIEVKANTDDFLKDTLILPLEDKIKNKL